MKTTKKILAVLLLLACSLAKSQNKIELSFIKLDEKENMVQSPESSNEKDKLLVMELFGLENIKNYQEISCIIQTTDFHVDEYTFPFSFTSESEEFYSGADVSTKVNAGTKYKRLLIAVPPSNDNPDGIGQFNINFTKSVCGYKYIYSREGCGGNKEYTLTAKVIGQNYEKKYDPKTDMYYNVPSHDPVLLSNEVKIKITTSSRVEKQAIELTIGKKSDLFDAIKQGNEKVDELNDNKKPKKKK